MNASLPAHIIPDLITLIMYYLKSINYETPQYAVSSILPSLLSLRCKYSLQTVYGRTYFITPSAYLSASIPLFVHFLFLVFLLR
jgi:hypothetical protein